MRVFYHPSIKKKKKFDKIIKNSVVIKFVDLYKDRMVN